MVASSQQFREIPDSNLLAKIQDLYDRGLYIQALSVSESAGPISSWLGVEQQILGARLAGNLGAARLAAALYCRACHADRGNPAAIYFRAASLFQQRGPLRAWWFLQRHPDLPGAALEVRADYHALKARVLAAFRDFDSAEVEIKAAIDLAPDHSWVWCEKAAILHRRDDHAAGYAAVQHALSLRPFYRPAVQLGAELLQLLGRDDEAVDLLVKANAQLESGAVVMQLAALQGELGEHEAALEHWRRSVSLHPLAEPPFSIWLNGQLADACYHAGRFSEAAEYARKAGGRFYQDFAARLDEEISSRRVVLPVAFVAQHYSTCAPATLSALSAYWRVAVDHIKLAAEICYGGTSDYVERGWVENNGFVACEFRVTWQSACALIDRGVPFTLTTVETTSAHLQALVGYDLIRRTFLLRDPSRRNLVEVRANEFLERYAAFGPRGMVMVPKDEASRLDGVELPDADLYDHFHVFQKALARHDRDGAESELEALEGKATGHRITLHARRCLAIYDAHPVRELEAVEGMLDLHPGCPLYLWAKACLLQRISPGKEHRRFLHQIACDRSADPVFWCEWARTLGLDARHARFADRYLLLALRAQPYEPGFLSQLGDSLWNQRRFESAADIYRLAACVGGVDRWGWSYFQACRHTRRSDEALHLLRARYEMAGNASAQPARILFNALVALDRSAEAFALLDNAIDRRGEDGQLLVFAADEFACAGKWERAEKLLADAEARASRNSWLRAKAHLANYRCDLSTALKNWRTVLEQEPLALDALRSVARLTAETEGRGAALAFLEETVNRHPHFLPLAELHIEFLRSEPPQVAEKVIRSALARDSRNAWLHRELALTLANQRRFGEAGEEVDKGLQIDPHNPDSFATRGRVCELEGRIPAAAESFRAALKISIDHSFSMEGLLRSCQSFEDRKAALEFVRTELVSQVVFGDGILAFRDEGYPVLEPAELLAMLREALSARPDLWQAWVAVIAQLVDLGRLEEARRHALEAVDRFPLVPRVWFELSVVYSARGESLEAIPPLQQALAISPAWGAASRALSTVLEKLGRLDDARSTLDRAIAAAPLDAFNHGFLAGVLWKQGRREEALFSLQQALRIDPDYSWAWEVLKFWSVEMGRPEMNITLARELARERSGEARLWLRLAEALAEEDVTQAIEATKTAIGLEPYNANAHEHLAVLHCMEGRFGEALEACAPAVFREHQPLPLQGREAWIEAQRGNILLAIEKMRGVVRRSPDYFWGWRQLADWLTSRQQYSSAMEAAQAMARLQPRSAMPLGYIAELQLQIGESRAAWDTFRKAFNLDPDYQYAGTRLFDAQLRSGDLKGAEETLALLELHHPGASTNASRVRLLCRLGRKEEALSLFREICFTDRRHSAALVEAADAISEAGWETMAMKLYGEILHAPTVNPDVGALWARVLCKRKYWISGHGLASLDPRSPVGRAARIVLLEKAAETGRRKFVKRLLRRDGAALREDTRAWGAGGYALATLQEASEGVRWLADWKGHPDAEPWMLYNLALLLRAFDRHVEARAVSIHATSLHGDHTTPSHHLFLAWDEAVGGAFDLAKQRLDALPRDEGSLYDTMLRAVVGAMISVGQVPPSGKAAVYESERVVLQQASWRPHWNDVGLSHLAREGIRVMAESAKKKPFRVGTGMPFFRLTSEPVSWFWILLGFALIQVIRACSGGQ